MMTLETIQTRFREIASKLGSPTAIPTARQDDGSAHAEHVGKTYFYVVTERGTEYLRRQTSDPDELLSWFVRDLTSAIALSWELENRIPAQDFRRLYFRKHVELLQAINQSWANQQQAEYDAVLAKHPFDDEASARLDRLKRSQIE